MKKTILFIAIFATQLCFSQKTIEQKIYFDFDKSAITETGKTSLDSLTAILKKYYKFSLRVDGYTDPVGNAAYNKNLADLRAKEVYGYLKQKGLDESNFNHVGGGKPNQNTPATDAKKRNCTILVSLNDEDKIYKEKQFVSTSGSLVTANIKSNVEIEVSDFFTTESMLANEMFAIDDQGNVLQTAGMIEINISGNPDEVIDGEIKVKMPIQPGETFDNQMTVWEEVLDKNGKTRWKETKIKLTKDKSGKYYEFNTNVRSNQRIRYNLDKPTFSIIKGVNRKYNNEIIYIATYKNFHFTDIALSDKKIKFATKINDSVYAFVRPLKSKLKGLVCNAVINDSVSKNVPFKAKLDNAQYSVEKLTKIKIFYICDKCNYFINGVEKNKKETPPEEKTGFFAWLKRLFS